MFKTTQVYKDPPAYRDEYAFSTEKQTCRVYYETSVQKTGKTLYEN
jgi:hypothetical protein